MSSTNNVNTTNIVNYINELIASVQSDELTTECPTGTVNDTNISCASWSTFTGTEGNTDTDGYYAQYTVSVNNILNVFNVALINEANYTSDGKTYATYTTSLTANYLSTVTANLEISGKCEVYIPQSQTTATACLTCTSTKCNKCKLKCGCGVTTKSNSCDCTTTTTTWPSTYSSGALVSFPKFPATVTAYGAVLTGNFTYTVSNENNTDLPVKQFYGSLLPNNIYLSNIKFSDLKITATNYTAPVIPGWPVSLNTGTIDGILNDITNYLENYFNNHINKYVYEFVPN